LKSETITAAAKLATEHARALVTTTECINLVCHYCADGAPVKKDIIGENWIHPNEYGGSFCKAYQIHNAVRKRVSERFTTPLVEMEREWRENICPTEAECDNVCRPTCAVERRCADRLRDAIRLMEPWPS
jgi:hypothetical protein